MVEWKKIGEICEVLTGGDVPNDCVKGQTCPSPNNPFPVYSNGNSIYGYWHNYRVAKDSVTISSIGNVGSVNYRQGYFTPVIRLKVVIPNSPSLVTKYLYYALTGVRFVGTNSSLSSMKAADIKKVSIPIPSLSEQSRIVSILDTFTASIENLKEQITERRKQYEYQRDQLLDLEGKEGVEIGSVAKFVKDRIMASELTPQNYTSVENLLKNKAGRQDAENVPIDGNWIKYDKGDVLIGNIRPYLRKIWLSDREGGTNGDVIVIRINDKFLPEYVYYCLASERFFLYYNQALKDGKMPRGDKNRVLSYVIPSIGKEVQSRIVSILDTFEASIANLEAQLELRQKQYEYYRNQLLTFE